MRLIDADAFDERVKAAGGMSEEELSEDFKDGVQTVLYMMSKQPTITAQPEQRWIPVSKKLPEDDENVLVTYKTTDKIHPCQYHDDGSHNPWYSYIDQCRAHMNVVLAWMPLPEPYREDKE